ncbi:MAG TPA: HlyD family efflux transporter periplasmic adaptor subunit [Vicinamibacterales bacterium]
MVKPRSIVVACALAAVVGAGLYLSARGAEPQSDARPQVFKVARRDFLRTIRLSGTVEAVQATTISTPRLAGQNNNSLIITTLVRPGQLVHPGDLLVEFDRQEQMRNALDKQAELNDLEQQVRKRRAQEDAARAADDSTLKQAESAQQRAQLEMLKNEMLPKIQAEKNRLALEEAQAKLKQLQQTYELKRAAAQADIRVLEIRRDRAQTAMEQAATNAERMLIKSPIEGIAVIKSTWKGRNMAEIQEGDEVRSGVPVVDVVNPETMRVRVRVNQEDIDELRVGQRVHVGLDAYPDLTFNGHVDQVSPVGVQSNLSPKVRNFIALVGIDGSHPNLMPDLSASLDVQLSQAKGALVVPLDAVAHEEGQAFVKVQRGGSFERQNVLLGDANTHETVVSQGLTEGNVIARNIAQGAR